MTGIVMSGVVVLCCYAECRYAECHYAECRYAKCHGSWKIVPWWHHDTQHNDIQHNDIHHSNEEDTQQNDFNSSHYCCAECSSCWLSFVLSVPFFIVMLSVVMLNVIILIASCCYDNSLNNITKRGNLNRTNLILLITDCYKVRHLRKCQLEICCFQNICVTIIFNSSIFRQM